MTETPLGGTLSELRSQRDAHFFVEQEFLFTCKNSKASKPALINLAALELRIICKYQLNLVQRGQSSNRDTTRELAFAQY